MTAVWFSSDSHFLHTMVAGLRARSQASDGTREG